MHCDNDNDEITPAPSSPSLFLCAASFLFSFLINLFLEQAGISPTNNNALVNVPSSHAAVALVFIDSSKLYIYIYLIL